MERNQIDRSVSRRGKDKHERIALGLELAAMHAIPHVPMTTTEIAVWCGCSQQLIHQIEREALKKLRKKLYCSSPVAAEFLEHIIFPSK